MVVDADSDGFCLTCKKTASAAHGNLNEKDSQVKNGWQSAAWTDTYARVVPGLD